MWRHFLAIAPWQDIKKQTKIYSACNLAALAFDFRLVAPRPDRRVHVAHVHRLQSLQKAFLVFRKAARAGAGRRGVGSEGVCRCAVRTGGADAAGSGGRRVRRQRSQAANLRQKIGGGKQVRRQPAQQAQQLVARYAGHLQRSTKNEE